MSISFTSSDYFKLSWYFIPQVDDLQQGVPDAKAESETSTKEPIEETRRIYPKYNQGG